MSAQEIVFENVSKFYGDVLGVNRVDLRIGPGLTAIVGPNGSGKSTLMNLMCGLIQPDRGEIRVLGISPRDPERLMRITGYATQFDAAPRWATGFDFVVSGLLLFGYSTALAERLAWAALERVGLTEAARRKVTSYSKGMRQRVRLAQAIAHDPQVLVLDEPLNGLDPVVRAETIALFRQLAAEGRHILLSSHVLHEVDSISDRVVLLANGSVIAEGNIRGVREEIRERPSQFLVRCADPARLAALLFERAPVAEVRVLEEEGALLALTRDRRAFSRVLTELAAGGVAIETVVPADENVHAVYEYLIGGSA
ncbi:MAG: ABC transporter ATP-binding protein [Bryobacteraceae bacterium]|nr:ABC transporter ATP-binding protein [Bryobacteraceae bacterium]MCX7604575.1 ABC transporter ATP-binding protein [Bryobacteraceae bacterium]